MRRLEDGTTVTEVARQLGIGRQTVTRYRAAAREQQAAVPKPRSMGGYRSSKVKRAQIVQLSTLATENPKRTLVEIRELAEADGMTHVSLSTIARSLHKSGLRKRRARHVDPKTNTHALIAAERIAFRRAQASDPHFAPEHLLFYDETFFRLNEQARSAWGLVDEAAPVLYTPKGRTATTGLFLTLGVTADNEPILHYELKPPKRPFRSVSATFEASELREPGRGINVGRTIAELRNGATIAELRTVLRNHRVKHTDLATRAQLAERVLCLTRGGHMGLPRAGRVDAGGPMQPFRATARDVARYWESAFVPWFDEHKLGDLGQRTVVWDNASTHSAVQVHDATRVSLFVRLFREWGFRGVVFLPPRSPSFNPAELCFAFLKHWVRKWAPDEGYTQDALEQAIRDAVERVTGVMIRNWIRGCGYGSADARPRPRVRRAPEARFSDARGTVRAAGSADDLVDIRATRRKLPMVAMPAPPDAERRWTGIGAQPPELLESQPKSYADALVDNQDTFEPERIVDERWRGRVVEYRVRWRGYDASSDTWEPVENLLAGRRQLLRDWSKRNAQSK